MKGFLFDENIPNRITFTPSLPVIAANVLGQAHQIPCLGNTLALNSYVIVTKDTDFSNRMMLSVSPPWVVHLRIGNMRKQDFHPLLSNAWPNGKRCFLPIN